MKGTQQTCSREKLFRTRSRIPGKFDLFWGVFAKSNFFKFQKVGFICLETLWNPLSVLLEGPSNIWNAYNSSLTHSKMLRCMWFIPQCIKSVLHRWMLMHCSSNLSSTQFISVRQKLHEWGTNYTCPCGLCIALGKPLHNLREWLIDQIGWSK